MKHLKYQKKGAKKTIGKRQNRPKPMGFKGIPF